ncbi:MAG: hypothetical protein HN389_10505 [Clostridia bacterium]|nr:hypothetical protein [Clostridia bacterium]
MHRRFYLENAQRQRFNLQDLKSGALLVSPAGLGLAMTRSYELTGDTARCVDERFASRLFTGVIVFQASRAYDGYRALINYIVSSSDIKLVYAPRYETATGEFLSDIEVESVSKREVRGGRMECDVAITLKGAWYKRDSLRVVAEKTGEELRYDRMYEYTYSDVSTDAIEIYNDGHFDAPLMLEAEGELVKPKLQLFVDGALRCELAVSAVIEEGQTLVYCTKDDELTLVKLLSDGSEESLVDSITVENDNFFKLPRGLSTLSLSADNEISSKSIITVFTSYKAV